LVHSLAALRRSGLASAVLLVALASTGAYWSISIARPSLGFAFAINWALMGIAYLVWLVWPLRFADGYYQIHRFERSGRLYEALGIRLFQRIMRHSGVHGPHVFPSYVRGPDGARMLLAATVASETAHGLIFVVVAVLTVDAALRQGWWDTAGWLLLFNVFFNAYPVLSLRYVRVRAVRIFGVSEAP
jgi:hypothetical protein